MGNNRSRSIPENLDTIPKRLQYWADTTPDRELFVFYNGNVRSAYTCRQVLQLAGKFAWRLRCKFRFNKGDVIVNTLENSPERLFIDLGIVFSGCICLNGTTMFSDGQDFLTAARNSCLVAAITCPEGSTSSWRILERYLTHYDSPTTAALQCELAPLLRTGILVSRKQRGDSPPFLQELLGSNEEVFIEPDIRPHDLAYVLTTSGSTGYSKLVPKTHEETIEMSFIIRQTVDQQSKQQWHHNVVYNDRNLGWMGGYPYGTYMAGEKRILLDVFDTEGAKLDVNTWKIVCDEKVDYATVMPIDLDNMVSHLSDNPGYKLKLINCGGQPIRKEQFHKYLSVAHEVGVTYGSTEAGIITFGVIPEGEAKDYYCSKVRPGVEVRIVDDEGQRVNTGQTGTIEVAGESFFFKGYLNYIEIPDPKTVTSFTKDGWFKTEDSGYFDNDGVLYVLGRLKDVIIFGATNVFPSWLECKIVDLPGVAQVCVVPVSDPVLYHNICAVIQSVAGSDLTENDVREFCENMFLIDKKTEGTPIPEFYLFLDDFPRTSTGKIDRKVIQQIAEKKFGITQTI